MSEWWLSRGDGKTEGPLSTEALVQGLVAGQIPKRAHVCRVGDQKWVRVSEIDEIWDAANPEQIKTNITAQPWFLSHADSGHHRLGDADADDEHTQVLTPLPMITSDGGNHPFVTPLPRSGTHRELLARQVATTPKVTPLPRLAMTRSEQQTLAANPVPPIRAKVPTLDGISDSAPPEIASEPPTDRRGGESLALDATSPQTREKPEPILPQATHLAHSSELKAPALAPLPQSLHGLKAPNLGTLSLGTARPAFGPPSGLSPLGVAPLGAPKPLPPNSTGMPVSIPSLQNSRTTTGSAHAGTQPNSPNQQRQAPPLQNAVGTEASRHGEPPGLPKLDQPATQPRPALPGQPPLPGQPSSPVQPRFPSPPAALSAMGNQSSVPAASPSLPAPSLTQPRPLHFGPGLPPAASTKKPSAPVARIVPVVSAARPAVATTTAEKPAAPHKVPREPSSGTDELELELTEDNELTTIAQKSPFSAPSTEAALDDDDKTTIAHKSSVISETRGIQLPAPSAPPPPLPFASNLDSDDESTQLVSAADLPGGRLLVPTTASAAPTDDEPTTRGAPRAPIQAAKSLSNPLAIPAKACDARPAPKPTNFLIATPAGDSASAESIVSDPSDLLEEGDDEPVSQPKAPHVLPSASRHDAAKRTAAIAAANIAISTPSAPPAARRPRLPSSPSIVLRPEPIIHQEATQPAVRALRRPGTVQLSYGTLVVILLAIALVALAIAYFLLKPR